MKNRGLKLNRDGFPHIESTQQLFLLVSESVNHSGMHLLLRRSGFEIEVPGSRNEGSLQNRMDPRVNNTNQSST